MEVPIDGVTVKELELFPNSNGNLMTVQRRDEKGFPGFGQVYVTQTFAGVIKAWYRHKNQIDQIAIVSGSVKLVLFDDREDSATRNALSELILADTAPRLVLIPPGIWHGFQAVGTTGAFLLHLNTEPYLFDAPDEERLESGDPSIPYSW
jgi:dTDP-4-dehydrorhamnose 3,5-epimerase